MWREFQQASLLEKRIVNGIVVVVVIVIVIVIVICNRVSS
jgi:hypothetical protein